MRTAIWMLTASLVCGPMACRPTASAPAPPQPAQGVRGQVVKLVGDHLPSAEPGHGQRVPMAVPVHVFRGRVQPIETPDAKHAALVRIVRADAGGRFALSLPPGEYTLVAEIDGQLYLNNWMDDGSWATITVRPGHWAEYVIEDVREAEF